MARLALVVAVVLVALFALANAVLATLLWDLGRRGGEGVPVVAVILVAGGVLVAVGILATRRRWAALGAPAAVAVTSGLACLWLGPF